MMDILKAFINKQKDHAEWLLEEFSNNDLINEYLLESPMIEMKKLVVGLLYASMIKSFKTSIVVSSMIEKNNILQKFINNILDCIVKNSNNSEKDLSMLYYILYRFCLLGNETKLYLIDIGLLNYITYYYASKNDIYAKDKICNNKDIIKANYYLPSHLELNRRLMNKVDRLSAFEETLEKKHNEKVISNKSDYFMLMVFCQLAQAYDIKSKQTNFVNDISKDPNLLKYLDFTNASFLEILLLEVKSKSSATAFSKMMCYLCHNNNDYSNSFLQILLECIKRMDSYELEYIMIIFKKYLINIDDSYKDSRVKFF
jgi:hypothetical protein